MRRRAGSEWVLGVEGIDQPYTHPGFAALRLDLDTLAQFGVNGEWAGSRCMCISKVFNDVCIIKNCAEITFSEVLLLRYVCNYKNGVLYHNNQPQAHSIAPSLGAASSIDRLAAFYITC